MRERLRPFADLVDECEAGGDGPLPAQGYVHLLLMGEGEMGDMPLSAFLDARSLLLPSRGEDQGESHSQPCTKGSLPLLKEPPCDLDGWQPIETAPLDGSYVDLWAFWPESEVWRRSPDARWGGDDWFMDRQYQRRQFVCPPVITHWMRHRDGPVPALPLSSTGEA